MSSAIDALAKRNRDLEAQLAEIKAQFVNLQTELDLVKEHCRNITLFGERIEVALEGK